MLPLRDVPALLTHLEHVDIGMIRDLKSGEKLTAQQLAERLAQAPRVLVGEQHNNPDHHALELWIMQVLVDRRPQGSLFLEMLNPSQQSNVEKVKAAYTLTDPADIPAALGWQEDWDWALYGPVVRYALGQPYPLLSANLAGDEIAANRRMAQQLLAAPAPALLFAGAHHVRKDVGVPLHLLDLDAQDTTVVLMLAEVGTHVTSVTADYVWYTAASRKDHGFHWRNQSP
ncbi:ChaN family lipoprotein [Pseudomonas sp.]|uniref:ChaN family lipoprotein n=1 Tax=Pseudomonas sp. TaxID=306 RepID=UPI00262C36AF|nr:ChaN family lipoprotein [Pseudomonas sp.]